MPDQLYSQTIRINLNKTAKKISIRNKNIAAVVDYNQRLNISSLVINGQPVIAGDSGIYSMIATKEKTYSTLHLAASPSVEIEGNTIRLKKIAYGDQAHGITERWAVRITADSLTIHIDRTLTKNVSVENAGLPVFTFSKLNTWDGAYQDYGGIAWFYLFHKKLDTYGVHSQSSAFWNAAFNNGMTIATNAQDKKIAMAYRRTPSDHLVLQIAVSPDELIPRFDPGTNRRRFVRDTDAAVWSTYTLPQGNTSETIAITAFNVERQYGRGHLAGINQQQVSAVLNTIARMGVIDKQHFGGNSWHTPYGPICLHEQYIAQLGLAINDPNYLTGYRDCLDFYRDNAVKPDGRVWPRWAYTNEDAMPAQFNDQGFYEAQWGYLLDSNPDYVTNVAELYDQNGDLDWVRSHQASCESALDWITNRDQNKNGLVEMMTDSTGQKRGSDWIDIIWAAYENAFVNAKLYHALRLWAHVEEQLGNNDKANQYNNFAQQLKTAFNKPTSEGGFWDEAKSCYVHWRDKDASAHGNNVVVPVNFMAIAYNICDDDARRKKILDQIETQMQKENLFFWPLCLYSYAPGEGNDWQFPFPNYENGDIFLSWGATGVAAYASYKPEIALKYIKNVLDQYARDGLAFQRYGRQKQDGLGDDILSGNSLAIVGLYQAIYGVNPLHNRLYLDPHLTPKLAGTELNYNYRGMRLKIELDLNRYAVATDRCKIFSSKPFGFYKAGDTLSYFHGNTENASLMVAAGGSTSVVIDIGKWDSLQCTWKQTSTFRRTSGKIKYRVLGLQKNKVYGVFINNKFAGRLPSGNEGSVKFEYPPSAKAELVLVKQI